jgi:hypothetical protein
MMQTERIIFHASSLVIELMIDQGPPKKFLPGAPTSSLGGPAYRGLYNATCAVVMFFSFSMDGSMQFSNLV